MTETIRPTWQKVFHTAVAPLISDEGLTALATALETDDPRLIQGATTTPPPLMCVQDYPVEAACAITLTGWLGDGLVTVGECETYFARMCYHIDQALGEPAGCRHFLGWYDETPRDVMRQELLASVRVTEAQRRL